MRPAPRPFRPARRGSGPARRGALAVLTALGCSAALLAAPAPVAAAPASRSGAVSAAAAYGAQRGYHVGVAVLDTRTGRLYSAGDHRGTFASESVVKTMIATRVFVQGRLHGATRSRVYTMITRSDDQIASDLYGSVGGDSLITWVKSYFHLPELGSPPRRTGWWGNTHITADGMVRFYAKVKAMPGFGAFLLDAMGHAASHGSDGFYQWFGLKQADPHAAIKQGWGTDYDNWSSGADENTTGFVGGGRYAVAILARGSYKTYGGPIGALLTSMARLVLPGGAFPSDAPVVTSLSATSGRTAGGAAVTLHGHDLDGTTRVLFGSRYATSVRVRSSSTVTVRTPAQSRSLTSVVRVITGHGTSSTRGPAFRYVAAPTITALSATHGSVGSAVTVTARDLVGGRYAVRFGPRYLQLPGAAAVRSLRFTVPAGLSDAVPVQVVTLYGTSAPVTFTIDPATRAPAPPATSSAPAATPSAASPSPTVTPTIASTTP